MTKLNKAIRREFRGRMTSRRYVVEIKGGEGGAAILSLREFGRHLTYHIDLETIYLRLARMKG